MRTPEEIMHDLEARVALIQEQAARAERLLAESETTAKSEEEIVTVTVNAGGTMSDLRFSPLARGVSGPGLARLVLDTYRRAVEESAAKTAEIMAGLVGGDSEAMNVLGGFTRPREED